MITSRLRGLVGVGGSDSAGTEPVFIPHTPTTTPTQQSSLLNFRNCFTVSRGARVGGGAHGGTILHMMKSYVTYIQTSQYIMQET